MVLPSLIPIRLTVPTGMPEYSMYNLSLREDWSKSDKFCVNIAGKERSSLSASCTLRSQSLQPCDEVLLKKEPDDQHVTTVVRRLSESCDPDLVYWQTKIPSLHDSDDDESVDHTDEFTKRRNGEDDEFYEEMDKKYIGTPNGADVGTPNGSAAGSPNGSGVGPSNGSDVSNVKRKGGAKTDFSDIKTAGTNDKTDLKAVVNGKKDSDQNGLGTKTCPPTDKALTCPPTDKALIESTAKVNGWSS